MMRSVPWTPVIGLAALLDVGGFSAVAAQECRRAGDFLAVEPEPQPRKLLCWAASATMVMSFMRQREGDAPKLCEHVGRVRNDLTCCDRGGRVAEHCDGDNWPRFEASGFSSKGTRHLDKIPEDPPARGLSWDGLCHQISRRRTPFVFAWEFSGVRHAMVVSGYRTVGTDERKYVRILDPRRGDRAYVRHDVWAGTPTFDPKTEFHVVHLVDIYDVELSRGRAEYQPVSSVP
jgi:hypothetical protein